MKYRPIRMPAHAACAVLRHGRRLLRARVSALLALPDAAFAQAFPGVVAAVEAAFRHEEALLELLGEACLHPRRADHAVILCALHRSAARVEGGDLERGRQVVAALDAILAPPAAFLPARGAARPPVWLGR